MRAVLVALILFAFPRFLIGFGIPIDQWAEAAGKWVHIFMTTEQAGWAVSIILGSAGLAIGAYWPQIKSWIMGRVRARPIRYVLGDSIAADSEGGAPQNGGCLDRLELLYKHGAFLVDHPTLRGALAARYEYIQTSPVKRFEGLDDWQAEVEKELQACYPQHVFLFRSADKSMMKKLEALKQIIVHAVEYRGTETDRWLALFREREGLEEQVSQLKVGLPLFSIRSELKKHIVGMDEDDVREEQIKRKGQRIIELTNMMASIRRL